MTDVTRLLKQAGWADLREHDSEMKEEIFMGRANDLKTLVDLAKAEERERIASQIDRMPFGDTAASFAVWIRAGAP